MHLGILGVVGIFTGIISPVIGNTSASFPFPLTDLQIPAYLVLLSLAIICILLTVKSWGTAKFFCLIVLGLIGYLFIKSWNGEVRTLWWTLVQELSWGWIFLTTGSGLLIRSMFDSDDIDTETSLSDHLIGWLGAVTILALTGLIISISYIPNIHESNKSHIIEWVFWSGWTETRSGITLSAPFSSIEQLIFDRKRDSINFFTSSWTNMVSVPNHVVFDRLPYATTSIWDSTYTINAEWFVSTASWDIIGKAILPQDVEKSILMYSGSTLMGLNSKWIQSYSGEYTSIENITTSKNWKDHIWKSKTGTGYTLFKNGKAILEQQYEIMSIAISPDWDSIMAHTRDTDGSHYIMKNGVKIEKIGTWYIEWTLRMNGTESIYTSEHDNAIELVQNGTILDRKFDEIREIFLDRDGGGYTYFGRPLGEQSYCLYTRYRGNLCGLTGYMNPRQSPDGISIIYAWLKDGNWGIYRNATPIIRNTGYPNKDDISRDYVFFDITNPSYYLFIRWSDDGYRLYKKWAWVEGIWKDVGLDATFGYDNKIIMSIQDKNGWRLIEF